MSRDEQEAAYLRRIEQRFRELRQAPLLLSPGDFRLAQSWYEQGVPLWLVLETLEELFARARATGRDGPRSLQYCRPAIDAAYRGWCARQVGRATSDEAGGRPVGRRQTASSLLETLRDAVSSSEAPDDVRRAMMDEITALEGLTPASGEWQRLDELLVARCLAALAEPERRELERRAELQVAPYREAMQEATLARARRAALKRLVRERFRLPDLTLIPIVRS